VHHGVRRIVLADWAVIPAPAPAATPAPLAGGLPRTLLASVGVGRLGLLGRRLGPAPGPAGDRLVCLLVRPGCRLLVRILTEVVLVVAALAAAPATPAAAAPAAARTVLVVARVGAVRLVVS